MDDLIIHISEPPSGSTAATHYSEACIKLTGLDAHIHKAGRTGHSVRERTVHIHWSTISVRQHKTHCIPQSFGCASYQKTQTNISSTAQDACIKLPGLDAHIHKTDRTGHSAPETTAHIHWTSDTHTRIYHRAQSRPRHTHAHKQISVRQHKTHCIPQSFGCVSYPKNT